MIPMSLKLLAKITNGKLYGNNLTFDEVSTDTNKLKKNSLFVAILGKRFDAHQFIDIAISNGAKAVLVNKYLPLIVPQVVVQDTCLAFGKLASWVRKNVQTRIVALTGTSGKTSVKEMTASILNQCGPTLYTMDNLNNHLGVSMTLLRLTKKHKYAIIELGANHKGEIAYSAKLTAPENVLINNISKAHLEGFGSLNGVSKAKSEIFYYLNNKSIVIINNDSNDLIHWNKYLTDKTIWNFSVNNNFSDFFASNITTNIFNTYFTMNTPFGSIPINLPMIGKHNVANALAAAALAISVNANINDVQIGLNNMCPFPGRLFPIYLSKYKLLIDDSYNSNLSSINAAIQVLSKIASYRVMVISDMSELGKESQELHCKAGYYAKKARIDLVLSIGINSYLISKNSTCGEHFNDKQTLIKKLKLLLLKNEKITILIKGSRNYKMEQIVHSLLQENKYVHFS
ncbi:MAG: UDP-N-acetylmuramoyl-tripeptide--D-alanyl-D-alanine ligase [Pantoea sp. Brub]|nr:UDP-N-acetylmuramoyl-tripeptide--D-alanyl-D-alanine ligase [Pantoea sp. Brub]